ncbi:glycine/sarcosine/betaine reductase selenoprotein B family protein [Methylobacterium indicum]|uniref:glycine/sarcosine/betaine reductase selenoprotein B family protein n=1 Tax=Methylobacterium indicum TaxID=1775910 RepID=UPI002435EEB5|nr:glycine/sarcosine/betaine reductase selenoprotein B family protein [Methylobacterium indicum]
MDASAELDEPIPYMARTRAYYGALGYPPYRWAHLDDVPFASLGKPLGTCCLALVTTAAPYQPDKGDQGPGAPYNGAAKFFTVYSAPADVIPDLRIAHVAYDRDHARADDPATYFPLAALRAAVAAGRVGRIAARFHGLPTNRSQRVTTETDAPEIVARIRADGADAAILVANCPVCHLSLALAARALEAAGIAAVLMGCAKDVVEHCGVPRFLFSDFPLGHAAGRPHDRDSQEATLDLALTLLESAAVARTTVQSPQRWSPDPSWKADYASLDRLSAEEIARRRADFESEKRRARPNRTATGAVAS